MTDPDTATDTAAYLHLPSGRFRLPPDVVRDLPQRLEEAARGGEVLTVPVLGDGETVGVAVVSPSSGAVVLAPREAFGDPPESKPTW